MSATLLIVLGVMLALAVVVMLAAGGRGRSPRRERSTSGLAEREAAMAAQADIEDHDIEEMLAAREALRARTGRRSLGDELADEALDESDREGQ